MAHLSEAAHRHRLVYPLLGPPGCVVMAIAAVTGFIGAGFIVLGTQMVNAAIRGRFDGPSIIAPIFPLIGVGAAIYAVAILLQRRAVLIDPESNTVQLQQSWGPIIRREPYPGTINSIQLMHDTLRTQSSSRRAGGSSAICTVCVLGLRGINGPFWKLQQRPTSKEAAGIWLTFRGKAELDYESIIRAEARKLSAATGWRVEDRLDPGPSVCAAAGEESAPRSAASDPLSELAARLPGSGSRSNDSGARYLESLNGPSPEPDPLLQLAASLPRPKPTYSGFLPAASEPTAYRIEDVKPSLQVPDWLESPVPRRIRRRGSTFILSVVGVLLVGLPPLAYLGWVGFRIWLYQAFLGRQFESAGALKYLMLVPYALLVNSIVQGIFRREARIARAMHLGACGRMAHGLLLRRVQKAGEMRSSMRVTINGATILGNPVMPWDDPNNQFRYEFMIDNQKCHGYVNVNLLGILRRDGLVAVVYDPLHPEVHLPLPVLKRYLKVD